MMSSCSAGSARPTGLASHRLAPGLAGGAGPLYKTHRLAVPNASVFGPGRRRWWAAPGRRSRAARAGRAGPDHPRGAGRSRRRRRRRPRARGRRRDRHPGGAGHHAGGRLPGDRDLFQLIDDARAVRCCTPAGAWPRSSTRLRWSPGSASSLSSTPTSPPSGRPERRPARRTRDRAKTAASLLATFGTLEALLDAAARGDPRLLRGAEAQRRSGLPAPGRPGRPHRPHAGPPRPGDRVARTLPPDTARLAELAARWGIGDGSLPGPSPPSASPRPPEPAGAGARALDSASHLCCTYLYV